MDAPSYSKASVTGYNIFCIYSAMIFSIVDVVLDYILGITHFTSHEWRCGISTAFFVYVPAFINIYISNRLYKQDLEMSSDAEIQRKYPSISRKLIERKLWWPLIILIPLVPVLRCIDSLEYARKVRKYERRGDRDNQLTNYTRMLKEDQDIAFLRVFECFLEAAPQAIAKITLMLYYYRRPLSHKQPLQVFSICMTLVVVGLTMANYNRVIRLLQADKSDITKVGQVLQFLSYLMITVSRFVSVALVASVWLLYTCFFIVLHWIVMTTCIRRVYSDSVENLIRDRRRAPHTDLTFAERMLALMLAGVYGVIYIFIFVNLSEGPTFNGRTRFYILCFIENMTACFYWAYFATPDIIALWCYELLIVLCVVPFFIGVISMIFYYRLTHITKKEKPTAPIEMNGIRDIPINYAPINENSEDSELTELY